MPTNSWAVRAAYSIFLQNREGDSDHGAIRDFHLALVKRGSPSSKAAYKALWSVLTDPKREKSVYLEEFKKAAGQLADELGVSEDELSVRASKARNASSARDLARLSKLAGVWFVVQHRTARAHKIDPQPAWDTRVAVLVYGHKDDGSTWFQMLGPSTRWDGTVRREVNQLIYDAQQVREGFAPESLRMVLHLPHDDQGEPHHGIALGAVHGPVDHPSSPIYSSHVSLYPVLGGEWRLSAPLDPDNMERLREACRYVKASETLEGADPADHSLLAQCRRAVKDFGERVKVHGNEGNRLICRG